jgi:hypothetical protein
MAALCGWMCNVSETARQLVYIVIMNLRRRRANF